ncbi:hypothetical protein HUT18_24625 [Streptomyces sp. NA04227]|uniref:hypothetical protein n=1 Tax=Streptomyces sp. NA04227 TaxID=2742136 RepID=UPI0015905FB7|nr:hypothetical protein [Streptomyces sp. NA04227]QKW09092.1 hypothetical protein HUT18_24625 [Streptomyces sp. NA04227]
MRTRTTIAMAALALALSACGDDKRDLDLPPRPTRPEAQRPAKLNVGDTYRYDDGVEVKVLSISRITEFGKWDDKPPQDKVTLFRVTWMVSNGGKDEFGLDDLSPQCEGAKGGFAGHAYIDKGSKPRKDRSLAPTTTETFTEEATLAHNLGKTVKCRLNRIDIGAESGEMGGEYTSWTGDIK